MKKTLFLFISSLFLGSLAYSQNTTQEEYMYIKSGILAQVNTGQDVQKKGYALTQLGKVGKDSYSFDFWVLNRENGSIAGIWVHAISLSYNNEYSLCLPMDTPDLKNAYENDVKKWDAAMSRAYANALAELLTFLAVEE